MTLSCRQATISLGAYLVGSLDHAERAEIDAHLGGCPACRDELARLAPLPGLMSRLSVEEVEALPASTAVSDAMLERLLVAAGRERRVARHRRLLSVAAAVVLVTGGSAAGLTAYNAMTAPHWHTVSATHNGVRMSVDMKRASTGTSLTLRLSGVPAEEHCQLVAVSDTGAREVAGSWEATYAGTATISGTTGIPYAHLAQLVIQTDDGQQLVSVPV
jgi:anti-sigma factor RsiW